MNEDTALWNLIEEEQERFNNQDDDTTTEIVNDYQENDDEESDKLAERLGLGIIRQGGNY